MSTGQRATTAFPYIHIPTGRTFHLLTFGSNIVPGCYFAIVTDSSKDRTVHVTDMYSSKPFAKQAAKEWAEKSQSVEARSLQP